MEIECETIPQLLESQKIKTLDFLKTDIEGLDPEIIRSCESYLGQTHFIQCELRFRPFYQTQPYFQDTVNFLAKHGYEVLDILHIDRWRYKTPNSPFFKHKGARFGLTFYLCSSRIVSPKIW